VTDPHITLKKPEKDDLDFIQWLWSDQETMKSVGGPVIMNDQEADEWFRRMVDPGSQENRYRLILNLQGIPIGEISYHRLDPRMLCAEFNIKIASQYRGKGFAGQAMLLFLDEYFNIVGGQVMIDKIALSNLIGQRALLEFGFEHEPSSSEYFLVKITRKIFNKKYQY